MGIMMGLCIRSMCYQPFTKIKNWWARSITMLATAWFLGVLCQWLAGRIVDLETYGFPILAGLFFWIVFTDFSFHLWAKVPPLKKAVPDLIFWYSMTVLAMLILPKPGLIPAWWFASA